MKKLSALLIALLLIVPMFSMFLPEVQATQNAAPLGRSAQGPSSRSETIQSTTGNYLRGPLAGMDGLYIDYARTDDYANYPYEQYDFGSWIGVEVDVDNSDPGTRHVDIWVYLRTPNLDIVGERDEIENLEVTGTGDGDSHWFFVYNDYDYLQYAGTQWHLLIIVRDHFTFKSFEQRVYIYIGPILKEHFTCKDPYNPYATQTSLFYDTDALACEYTVWDTHNLHMIWDVQFDFYDPMGFYLRVDKKDNGDPLETGTGDPAWWIAAWIYIKGYTPESNPGGWYVDVLLDNKFRARDGFDIMETVLPSVDVSLVSPTDGSSEETSPIELEARVTSDGSPIQDALVRFYVGGSETGVDNSDSQGYASIDYYPSAPDTYSWYAKAEKTGYTEDISPTWSFIYAPPAPPPPEYTVSLSSRTTDGQTNVGSIEFDGQTYNLPASVYKIEETYQVTANPPKNYGFELWEYGGSISVSSSTSQTTSVTIWGDCSLKAVFEGTFVEFSVSATIIEPPVLRETVGLGLTLKNTGTAQLDAGSYIVTISFWDYPEEGGIDSFGVRYIHHHEIQLGPPQPMIIEIPALAPEQEYTLSETLRFPVLDHQQPTLILTDTIEVVVEGYGHTASTQIKNVDVIPGLETFCNAILAIVTEFLPIKDEEVKLAINLGLPVLEAQIENAMEELSNAIAAANEGDVAEMAKHFAKMGMYVTLWTTLLSPEEQLDFLIDIAWAFLDGPFSIANLIIFWVNFKYETYLQGFDLISLSFLKAIGAILGLSFLTDPVNLWVTDPLGRHAGQDPETGLIVNEIPDAHIYGIDGNIEAFFIPYMLEGTYDVNIVGISEETYALRVEAVADSVLLVDETFSGSILPEEILSSDVIVTETPEGLDVIATPPTPLAYAYTDKEEYKIGETVLLYFENIGDSIITLSNTAPWVILDDSMDIVYAAIGLMIPVDVDPGEKKEWQWDQEDDHGEQVPLGTYFFQIETPAGIFTDEFAIGVSEKYTLEVNVVDDDTGGSISCAYVKVEGPETASGITDGGSVEFILQSGDYTVTASAGCAYNTTSVMISLAEDKAITLRLKRIGPVGGFESQISILRLLAPWMLLILAMLGVIVVAKRKRKTPSLFFLFLVRASLG